MWGHTKNAWGYTKTATKFVASPITKLLRPSPKQSYVFENAQRSQNMAKAAFASDGHANSNGKLNVPQLAQLPTPQTPTYQERIHNPKSYQQAFNNPPVALSRSVEAQPKAILSTPRTTQDISFVKMGGGVDMNDWLMCEAEAGGFIRIVQGGYLIEPAFEGCMRARGYKPESEVAAQLSL